MLERVLYNSNNIPLKIILTELEKDYSDFKTELRIIFIINGSVEITIKHNKYTLTKNDFIVINSYELSNFKLKSADKVAMVELLIDVNSMDGYYKDFSYLRFSCFSKEQDFSSDKISYMKYRISQLVLLAQEKKKEKNGIIITKLLELCFYLGDNFNTQVLSQKNETTSRDTLMKIIRFLEENYMDDTITTANIADYVNLSEQYTLRFFKQFLGIGLKDYLNSLRINKSINELVHTNKSIIEIAIDNGFNNSKSYHRLFKEEYNTTPGQYRKENHDKDNDEKLKKINVSKSDLFEDLKRNLSYEKNELNSAEKKVVERYEVNIDQPLKHVLNNYWKSIMSLEKASDGLKGDIREHILEFKNTFNPKYIKFNGIFEDELDVYNEDNHGVIFYNYNSVDKFLDYLLSINLKPFINLGIIPKKFFGNELTPIYVKSKVNTLIEYPEKWVALVKDFFSHIIMRYGIDEVETWYFELWSSPNLNFNWKNSKEEFFRLFEETFCTIKEYSKNIKVGGPSIFVDVDWEWFDNFYSFTTKKNLDLDFLAFQGYNLDDFGSKMAIYLNKRINVNETIESLNNKLREKYNFKKDIFIVEWNYSPFTQDIVHETDYKNVFVLDTILKSFNTVTGLSYWMTIDGSGESIFQGSLGLMTSNYIKRSSYNTFLLINKLGNYYIGSSDDYFVSRDENRITMFFYNYSKFYSKDKGRTTKEMEIVLSKGDCSISKYKIIKYYLNKDSGSPYYYWLKLGAPQIIDHTMHNYLKSKEIMNMSVETISFGEKLVLKETLKENEIVFYEIIKK